MGDRPASGAEPHNVEGPAPPPNPPLDLATPPSGSGRRRALAALGVAAAGVAAVVTWLVLSGLSPEGPQRAAPSDDPRLAYRGPYQNVHPSVRYVGDAACQRCHKHEHANYHKHPMARTLEAVEQADVVERYGPSPHNPFKAFGAQLLVERKDGQVWHRERWLGASGEPVAELALPVRYAIGSGERGRSYLVARDGHLFQSPVSWYSQRKLWDKSPGFTDSQRTGRAVGPECLYCHSNQVSPREGAANRYHEPLFPVGHGIGCERCHGPGERHVATGGADHTIVNPRRLEHGLREAVCQQCHLEGAARVLRHGRGLFDFRPGLPLEQFRSVFVRATGGDDRKAVNHTEQMYQSLCFERSAGEGKLGCISCHDPHRQIGPERRVRFYRKRCLDCHKKHGCSLPEPVRLEKNQNSCIDCHMPRYTASDIVHTAATDHTVPRRPGAAPRGGPSAARAGDLLVDFFRGRPAPGDREAGRDLGLALVTSAWAGKVPAEAACRRAVGLLESALQAFPKDPAVWEGKAMALLLQGRPAEALASFQGALTRAPEREDSLEGAALMCEALGQREEAVGYWRRAVAVNPWMPSYRKHLVELLAEKGAPEELAVQCRAWLGLDPGSAEARKAWVGCLLRQGKREEARAEFARLEALQPAGLAELRAWFARAMQ
jgi:hypothetical protein